MKPSVVRALLVTVVAAQGWGCAQIVGADASPVILPPTCTGTVYVRIASDFSGTATDIAISHFFGIYDHLRYLNEHGGIMGCKIDIGVADNNYTVAGTETVVNTWRAMDPHWSSVNTTFIFGTGETEAVAASIEAEQKLIIPGSYAGALASPVAVDKQVSYPVMNDTFQEAQQQVEKKSSGYPYVFFPATDYGTAIRLAIQSAWTTAPGRMAFAHDTADKCAYCVDPLAAGQSYVKSLPGMDLGRDLIIPQTSKMSDAPTIDAAVQTYIQQEVNQVLADPTYKPVNWIWSGNSVMASSLLGQSVYKAQTTLIDNNMSIPAATRSAWHLRVIANNWGIGETAPGICGTACNHDNFYGLFPVARYGDINNASAMNDIIAQNSEFTTKDMSNPPAAPIPTRAANQYQDVRYVQGYVAAKLWELGMIAAIKAGHRNPTGSDLKNALETFQNVDTGATAETISFSSSDHRPQSGESIYKLDDNGQLSFVAKYTVPQVSDWLGW